VLRDAWESGSLFQGEAREAKNSDTGGALVDLGWFAAMVLLYASVLVPLHNPAQCFVLVEYQIHSRHSHISNIYIYIHVTYLYTDIEWV
jgi:hypothetical protein